MEDVDPQTLIKLVKFLKRGKVPSADTIHNEVLRLGTTTSLFHHLAKLFTSSIQLGYIPTSWKIVTLCMLLKPDKLPSLTTSYRPISLISSVMKLFERVIEQRLRSHLENIGFLNKHQSGFRRAKSTDDHLFRLSQSIMESFNRGEHVAAAFLDIEKAFDNVWHNGLRYKIPVRPPHQNDRLTIRFFSWLCNKSQCEWFLAQPNRPQSKGSTGFCPESITFSDLCQRPSNSTPQTKFSLSVC